MRVIVYLLIFGLAPGAAEAFVDVTHALLNGHTPHVTDVTDVAHEVVADADGDDHAHDEHHCTATFHLCGCHAPVLTTTSSVLASLRATKWSELRATTAPIRSALLPAADGAESRATRPPIV